MTKVSFARCANCGKDIHAIPRTNFYGLRKLNCQECRHTTTLPMRGGYRIAFYIVALWMAIGLAARLFQGGNLWFPALVLVIAIAAPILLASRNPVAIASGSASN
jgi:DNA-directed RNA polymerase subunit RPC12/RpoP